jgi:glycosyltransferase involved in cell wall biosynthesis
MSSSSAVGVMHVVDTLDIGGTETVAVNLANRLPRERYRPYLCTTRRASRSNALASSLHKDVRRLSLDRDFRFDLSAVIRLVDFIRREKINLLHVHSTSIFLGRLAALLAPSRVRVIWHDHYGRCELNDRPVRLYRLAISGAAGVIAVNYQLAEWARRSLHVSPRRVWYVPNFVMPSRAQTRLAQDLPGSSGNRIVCVGNLRLQKDHLTLIRAMAVVRDHHPAAHLLIAGAPLDVDLAHSLGREVRRLRLEENVTFLGQVDDVASILPICDIGVLSSLSEGLPLALLEYGWAGLPAVATSVGQCPEVLDHGNAGILVKPGAPQELATAIQQLLSSPERRNASARRLRDFVRKTFDPAVIVNQICRIYETVLSEDAG